MKINEFSFEQLHIRLGNRLSDKLDVKLEENENRENGNM